MCSAIAGVMLVLAQHSSRSISGLFGVKDKDRYPLSVIGYPLGAERMAHGVKGKKNVIGYWLSVIRYLISDV